jgi:PAS domain S-box-containing protein
LGNSPPSNNPQGRALPPAVADLVFEVDQQGRILDYHACHPELLYCPPKEFLGKPMPDVLPPGIAALFTDALDRLNRTGELATVEYQLPTRAGERWFEALLYAAASGPPDQRRNLVIVWDITDRKAADERTREAEARVRTILDQMQEAVVFADEHNVIRHMNAFACTYLNATWDQAVGQDLLEFHDPVLRPRITEIIAKLRNDPAVHVISRQRSLGDRELIFRFSAVRDPDGTYRGIIANLIDVTEIKQLEERLQEALRLESIARLAAGLAHDVNNLMVSVIGMTHHIRARLGPGHPESASLRDIERAGERTSELANQLVTYSRSDRICLMPVDFNKIVRDTVGRFRTTLLPGVRLTLHLADAIPSLLADPLKIERVLLNLCRNAAEAVGEAGRIAVRTSRDRPTSDALAVHPHLADANTDVICLTVEDDGCGMETEIRRRVFEPYFTTKDGGGLGLASVHGIVNNHHGHVEVSSEPGKGATFHVFLPASPPSDATSPDDTAS